MNRLTLSQRLRQEAGISGVGPTTTISQTGEMGRVVDWIDAAYEEIQSDRQTWEFLRNDFSFSTVADQQEYTPAQASATDHAQWREKDIRVYSAVTDESWLHYYKWDDYRHIYHFGSSRSQTGRPSVVSVKPDNSLILWEIPDAVYTINGEYYKTPDIMTLDADIPIIPARFHMIIVWKALMYYGAYAAAGEKYDHGQNEYRRMMRMMELDQLEQITFGDPLA